MKAPSMLLRAAPSEGRVKMSLKDGGSWYATPALQTLAVHRDTNGVAHVEMSRPAFDGVMLRELADTFEALGQDPAVRAVVLSGQGKVFSVGADLPQVKRANRASAEWSASDARAFAWMLWRIDSCAKPTIARVNGKTVGGGVGLVCACDFVVASGEASFTVNETGAGHVPSVIRPYLVKALGKEMTERLALSGASIDAEHARSIGLVQAVVADDELEAATTTLGSIFQNGPNVPRRLKSLISGTSRGRCRRQR